MKIKKIKAENFKSYKKTDERLSEKNKKINHIEWV